MGEGEVSPSLQPGASATFSAALSLSKGSGLQTPARNAWLVLPARHQNPLKNSHFLEKIALL